MADTKISGLPSAASLTGVELLPAVQAGSTTQATVNQLKTYVNTSPTITGGSINSTPIGATTPSTGAFTTLSATGNISSTGANTVGNGGTGLISAALFLNGGSGANTGSIIYGQRNGSNDWLIGHGAAINGGTGLTNYMYGANQWSVYVNAAPVLMASAGGKVLVGTPTDDGVNALQVNGAGIFAGLIKPQQAATASAPAYVKGAIYFDTTLNKLRVGGATAWETITSI